MWPVTTRTAWHCILQPSGAGHSPRVSSSYSPEQNAVCRALTWVQICLFLSWACILWKMFHGKQSSPSQGRIHTSSKHSASCPLPAQDLSNACAADAQSHNPRPNLPGRGETGATTAASACGCSRRGWLSQGREGSRGKSRTTQQQLKHRTDITRNHRAEQ